MHSTLRTTLASLVALAALALSAAPTSAASAYITDPGYDTSSGGTSAQKAAIDLRKVAYWTTDTRFYARFKVRNLTVVSGKKEYQWRGKTADGFTYYLTVADGRKPVVSFTGNGGASAPCVDVGARSASVEYDYVQAWVPRSCFPKGKALSYPYGNAGIFNSAGTKISGDRTTTGARFTPNP